VRHLLRPLGDIQAGAQRFGRGDFATPIPQRRPDELGALAAQVNAMATSLQHMLAGQRGLLLAISHELRSPLTRARLHAELLDDGAQRNALLRDLGQMRDLISDLLEGERLAAGGAALQREPVDLNALAQDLVDRQFAGRGISLDMADEAPPAFCSSPARAGWAKPRCPPPRPSRWPTRAGGCCWSAPMQRPTSTTCWALPLSNQPVAVPGVPGLQVLNIDPDAAAEAYRQRVLAQLAADASDDERSHGARAAVGRLHHRDRRV
jgi:hypothetical protein